MAVVGQPAVAEDNAKESSIELLADLNGDGIVDEDDLEILQANHGDLSCNWILTGED